METPDTPRCALHPDAPAHATCASCGNLMCLDCSVGGTQTRCPRCRAAATPPMPGALAPGAVLVANARRWTFDQLWTACWAAFKRDWLYLSLAVLLASIIGGVVGIPMQLFSLVAERAEDNPLLVVGMGLAALFVFLPAQLFVTFWMQAGVARMCLDALAGRAQDLARLFGEWRRAFVLLGAALLLVLALGVLLVPVGLGVGVAVAAYEAAEGARPLIVLGAVAAGAVGLALVTLALLPLLLLNSVVVAEDIGPITALRRCFELTRGRRLTLLGLVVLQVLVAVPVAVLTCCVGLLPLNALVQLGWAGVYVGQSGRLPDGAPVTAQVPQDF